MRVIWVTIRVVAGVVGGTVATIFFFYAWWILMYIVASIVVAANVPIQMSGKESVDLLLTLAIVSGAITAVAIIVVSGRMVVGPRSTTEVASRD